MSAPSGDVTMVFRFSDPNPLTSGTFAQSRFRDLPDQVAEVVESHLGLRSGDWNELVEFNEVYDVVGPHETFWSGRTRAGRWVRRFTKSGAEVVDINDAAAWF